MRTQHLQLTYLQHLHPFSSPYSTFSFQGLRLDEALRLYLEAFRLPGEAPVIQRLLEAFTEHWRVSLSDGLSPPSQVHLTEGFYGSN